MNLKDCRKTPMCLFYEIPTRDFHYDAYKDKLIKIRPLLILSYEITINRVQIVWCG